MATPTNTDQVQQRIDAAVTEATDRIKAVVADALGTLECPAPEPTPEPEPEPEPEPTVPTVTFTPTGLTFDGPGEGTGLHTLRASRYPLTDQTGFYVQGTPAADGSLALEIASFDHQLPRYWQLEQGGDYYTHGTVVHEGVVSATESEPQPEPGDGSTGGADGSTGGSGGAFTNRTFQPFNSNGLSSNYHIYAEGLDSSRSVGLLMYGDGSGGYGFDNPSSSYLIGGSNGLAAVARKHNLILVVPQAPPPGCDGTDNCWYDSRHAAKAQWSSDLMDLVKSQYDVDLSRIVIGGYSSGAQWTTQSFLPAHGERQSVDLAVAIAYGGAPRSTPQFSDEYVARTAVVFNTGTSDQAYTSASYGALGGYNWYRDAGFDTAGSAFPSGVGHGRSGEFGGIVDDAITRHLG